MSGIEFDYTFFSDFRHMFKMFKKKKKRLKTAEKGVLTSFQGACSTQKLVKIHNTMAVFCNLFITLSFESNKIKDNFFNQTQKIYFLALYKNNVAMYFR